MAAMRPCAPAIFAAASASSRSRRLTVTAGARHCAISVKTFGLTGEQLARWLRINSILLNDVEWGRTDLPPHALKGLAEYEQG